MVAAVYELPEQMEDFAAWLNLSEALRREAFDFALTRGAVEPGFEFA